MTEATVVKFYTHVGCIKLVVLVSPPPAVEHGRGHVTVRYCSFGK